MKIEELHDQLVEIYKEVLKVEEIELKDEYTAKEIPNYDSLAHIQVLIACQKKFPISLSAIEAGLVNSYGEMKEMIFNKINDNNA